MDFKIRENRKPGGGRLVRERAAYFELMKQGYSTRDAARIVGINLRTGKWWRNGWHSPPHGQKPVPPIYGTGPASVLPEAADSPGTSRFLTESERIHIADRLREKASIRRIASELGRSPSTVSREVRRNRRPMPNDGFAYQPFHAHRWAVFAPAGPTAGRTVTPPSVSAARSRTWS